jgi:type IV pilus assembly protein PilM
VFSVGATGRLVLQHFALEPHSSDPTHEARWAVEIAQSLGAISARQKLGGAAAIAVPGHLALTKFIKTPSVAKEKRGKIVSFEAAENIPYPLEEVVWDYLIVADDGFDLDVMLAASKFDAMQTLCGAADAAGFPVERAKPAALALYHAFRYNYPQVTGSVVVVNIGARSTNLLFVEGERFYLRTLPLAGNALTLSIAEELRIDFPSAETLKTQVLSGQSDLPAGSPSRAAVQRAAASFAQRLQLEITRSTVNHRRHSGAAAPVALYLTGGGSLVPELGEVLADKLRLKVERYEALKNVDVSGDARVSGAERSAAMLADLVGLATSLVAKSESETSLLPPALQQALVFRKRQPWIVAAAALAVLALLPPILYFHQVTAATEEKIRGVDSQLMPLRSLQNRNEQNIAQIAAAKRQIDALRGAFDTKANWISFFTDLQDRLVKVEDVWLDRVQVARPAPVDPAAPAEALAQAAAQSAPVPAADANPPADPNAPPAPPPIRMTLSGRLLDVSNPQSRVSAQATERVRALLASFKDSQFIAAVENERFDNNQNGLLKFDFTLVINPRKTL